MDDFDPKRFMRIGTFLSLIESRCTSLHKARLIELARTANLEGYITLDQIDAPTQRLFDSGDIVAYKGYYCLNKKYRQVVKNVSESESMSDTYQNVEILAYARDLALRDYDITVTAEEFADGTIGYLARTPELPGCKAQGRSVIEAVKSLIDARIDTIYFMLVDMIPVAPPNQESTGNATYQSIGLTTISASAGVTTLPRENSVTVRIPVVVPHVEKYADWDTLWVAILNGDVEEFNILSDSRKEFICAIRRSADEWDFMVTTSGLDVLRGRHTKSRAELLACIGYLSEGNVKRVVCLPKKANHD